MVSVCYSVHDCIKEDSRNFDVFACRRSPLLERALACALTYLGESTRPDYFNEQGVRFFRPTSRTATRSPSTSSPSSSSRVLVVDAIDSKVVGVNHTSSAFLRVHNTSDEPIIVQVLKLVFADEHFRPLEDAFTAGSATTCGARCRSQWADLRSARRLRVATPYVCMLARVW